MREQEDRDKRVWEGGVSPGEKIQGTRVGRTEYRAHEADIKVRREGKYEDSHKYLTNLALL